MTIADSNRVLQDRPYAHMVAERLLEKLVAIDEFRGDGPDLRSLTRLSGKNPDGIKSAAVQRRAKRAERRVIADGRSRLLSFARSATGPVRAVLDPVTAGPVRVLAGGPAGGMAAGGPVPRNEPRPVPVPRPVPDLRLAGYNEPRMSATGRGEMHERGEIECSSSADDAATAPSPLAPRRDERR